METPEDKVSCCLARFKERGFPYTKTSIIIIDDILLSLGLAVTGKQIRADDIAKYTASAMLGLYGLLWPSVQKEAHIETLHDMANIIEICVECGFCSTDGKDDLSILDREEIHIPLKTRLEYLEKKCFKEDIEKLINERQKRRDGVSNPEKLF